MVAVGKKMGGSPKRAAMGRKRKEQSPELRRSFAGKFGRHLESLSLAAGFTPDKLAKRIGKSDDQVRLYFSGRNVPPINDWPKLAKVLGVTVRELIPE